MWAQNPRGYRYLTKAWGWGDHLYGCSIEATAAAEYGLPLGVVYP
jgi:hypothetical protein